MGGGDRKEYRNCKERKKGIIYKKEIVTPY